MSLIKILGIGLSAWVVRDLYYNLSDKPKPPLVKPNAKSFLGQPLRLRPNRKWWQSKYY